MEQYDWHVQTYIRHWLNDLKFGEDLMFLLISKGYLAYLRGPETGNETRLFHNIVGARGWGLKIIDKRLELYNNEPRHKFMIDVNRRMRTKPIKSVRGKLKGASLLFCLFCGVGGTGGRVGRLS